MNTFEFVIVGGPWDGADGLAWIGHEPPQAITVGTCPGKGECAARNRAWCRQAGRNAGARAGVHVAYWTPDELADFVPGDGIAYALAGEPVKVGVEMRATYVAGPGALVEKDFTVADILAAAPKLPKPATAAARELSLDARRHRRHWPKTLADVREFAEWMGLRVSSGVSSGTPPSEHSMRVSDHFKARGWVGW